MRFLLYNIRYGTGGGWKFHFPLPFSGYLKKTHKKFSTLVNFITSTNPDIIGLLEADCGSVRFNNESQPKVLAQHLKHFYVYQSKYLQKSIWQSLPLIRKQGNAFLTNMEIKKQDFHYFRQGVKRLMIEIELEDVVVLLVHLSLKFRHRQEQLKDIYTHVKRIKKPLIVSGDFNTRWGAGELKLFLASTGLKNANKEGHLSHPSRSPQRELDFILHSPQIKINSFEMPDIRFSDHRPIVCGFEILTR